MKKTIVLMAGMLMSTLAANAAQAQGYCREYNKNVVIGGRVQPGYGQACMQPDGAWSLHSASGGVITASEPYPAYAPPVYAAPMQAYPPTIVDQLLPGIALALNVSLDDGDRHYDRGHRWRDDRHWRGERRWRDDGHRGRGHGHKHRHHDHD